MGKLKVWIDYWNKLVGINKGSSFSGLGMLASLGSRCSLLRSRWLRSSWGDIALDVQFNPARPDSYDVCTRTEAWLKLGKHSCTSLKLPFASLCVLGTIKCQMPFPHSNKQVQRYPPVEAVTFGVIGMCHLPSLFLREKLWVRGSL